MSVLLNEAKTPPFDIALGCNGIGLVLDIEGERTLDESFSVNLSSASNLTKDISIHFNPRPAQNKIVLNTMKRGKWGEEEIIGWYDMFNKNVPFKLRLTATQKGYEVYDIREKIPRLIATFGYRHEMECPYLVFAGQGCTIKTVVKH